MRTDGFLYIEQAAKQIGIHRNTLRRWVKEGKPSQSLAELKEILGIGWSSLQRTYKK